MKAARNSKAAKTMAERRAYSESVLGSTVESKDTTGSATSTVNEEATPGPVRRKRPTDWKYEFSKWMSEHKWETFAGLVLAVIGWLCLQQIALNREVGIASSKLGDLNPRVEKIDEKLTALDKEGSTLQFQVRELWDSVFKNRRGGPSKSRP